MYEKDMECCRSKRKKKLREGEVYEKDTCSGIGVKEGRTDGRWSV